MKTIIVIPAYNAEKTISWIIQQIKKMNLETVVIDDGSSDKTADSAWGAGAFVIRHAENQGKGASLRSGFNYALNKGYDSAIVMDSDGQHNPSQICAFLAHAEKNPNIDIIVGNRMPQPANMPIVRLVTNKVMSFIISGICKIKIPDTQCGFKFIKTSVLKAIRLTSCSYDIDSEILIKAGRKNFAIDSIPIISIYDKNITSRINPLIDTIKFFKLLFRLLVMKDE